MFSRAFYVDINKHTDKILKKLNIYQLEPSLLLL